MFNSVLLMHEEVMNFQEALAFAKDNYKELLASKSNIVGIAYTPEDTEAHFWTVDISLNEDDLEEGSVWFDVWVNGGHIPDRGYGIGGDSIGGESADKLIKELPPFVLDLNFAVYEGADGSFTDLQSPYALKMLLPNLPCPDTFDLTHFREQAVKTIECINLQAND